MVAPPRRSTLIGILLLALAMANLSLVEGMGIGLVTDVREKYEDLGASWVLVQYNSWAFPPSDFDPAATAETAREDPLVRAALPFWMANNFHLGDVGAPLTAYVPGPGYDWGSHPYVFIAAQHGGQAARVTLVKSPVLVDAGRFPAAPGEVALDYAVAESLGLAPGDRVPLQHQQVLSVFGDDGTEWTRSGEPIAFGEATVTGVVSRVKVGAHEEDVPLVLTAHDPRIVNAIQGERLEQVRGSYVAVQSDLHHVGEVAGRVGDALVDEGHSVQAWEPYWLEDERNGTRVTGARFGGGREVVQVDILADDAFVLEATSAALRAGSWYRLLSVGGLALAALGVGFVTAASARTLRRETSLLQALGFPPRRLYLRALGSAARVGGIGGVIGSALAVAFAASGLPEALFGLTIGVDVLRFMLLGGGLGAGLHALAVAPVQLRILMAGPAVNLRKSWE